VILSVAFIFYALVFGLDTTEKILPPHLLRILASTGVLIYAGTGVVTMALGGNYLEYNLLLPESIEAQHIGIMVIELGVGLTVCSVMLMIFFAFAGRGRQ
jgi:multicomponent Na+:H+ antiporter subunit B